MLRYHAALGASSSAPSAGFASATYTPSPAFIGCLILLGGLVGLPFLTGVAAAIMASMTFPRDAYIALVMVVMVCALLLWITIRKRRHARQKRESVTAYLEAASALIENPKPSDQDANKVIAFRNALLAPVPESARGEFELAYRRTIADAVADQEVSPDELRRLVIVSRGLGLSADTIRKAHLNGFMQGFSALIADHKLTSEEEAKLITLRKALKVPDETIQVHLQKAEELRRARQIGDAPLVPIETPAKLRKGEESYYTTSAREMKERVARTWVEDGERYTERELQEVRTGTLYVTNQRLLLLADGTTSIKLAGILDLAIDVQRNGEVVVSLTVDGRKTPHCFAFPEPYLTLAYIEKVLGLR